MWRFPVRLRSVYSSRACAVAKITRGDPATSTSCDVVSGAPSTIDLEQGGLKWLLSKMKAGRNPVLRYEFDEFIPPRVDDCVPWSRKKTLNQNMDDPKNARAYKPTAHKGVGNACNFEENWQQRQMR